MTAAAVIPPRYGSAAELPDGQYAIVEIMGYVTYVGRIDEVQKFGTALLQVEPLFDGQLLEPVVHGGQAIYRLTPCDKTVAWERHPRDAWRLPSAVRCRLAPLSLPGMETGDVDDVDDPDNTNVVRPDFGDCDDDDRPF